VLRTHPNQHGKCSQFTFGQPRFARNQAAKANEPYNSETKSHVMFFQRKYCVPSAKSTSPPQVYGISLRVTAAALSLRKRRLGELAARQIPNQAAKPFLNHNSKELRGRCRQGIGKKKIVHSKIVTQNAYYNVRNPYICGISF
jgi:hypothetical protein